MLALVAAAALSGGACQNDWFNFGNPRIQNAGLGGEEHEGRGWPVCTRCHRSGVHEGIFTPVQCVACHGSNGAPVLGTTHDGWGVANCEPCHPSPAGHGNAYSQGDCTTCHRGNGGPALTSSHDGYQVPDCFACHPRATVHAGVYNLGDCTPCHGDNGAPHRPGDHWMLRCNDCHAAGPEAWNEATHAGLESLDPKGCAGCHPAP